MFILFYIYVLYYLQVKNFSVLGEEVGIQSSFEDRKWHAREIYSDSWLPVQRKIFMHVFLVAWGIMGQIKSCWWLQGIDMFFIFAL